MKNYLNNNEMRRRGRICFLFTGAIMLAFSCAQIPSEQDTGMMSAEEFDAQAKTVLSPPAMPEDLKVPPSNELFLQLSAEGVQIYRWQAGKWQLRTTEANLYEIHNNHSSYVGFHYGSTWEYEKDDSSVQATEIIVSSPSSDTIPWQLLRSSAAVGNRGILSATSYVQRIHTSGGTVPAGSGQAGDEIRAPYAAEYLFYRQSGSIKYPYAPAILRPVGQLLAFSNRGEGTVTYRCKMNRNGKYSFVKKSTEAILYKFSGPKNGDVTKTNFRFLDGSTINSVQAATSTSPSGSLPWQLLNVTSHPSEGMFSQVTQIQRLETTGGLAPQQGCDANTPADREFLSPYTANYYFYKLAPPPQSK